MVWSLPQGSEDDSLATLQKAEGASGSWSAMSLTGCAHWQLECREPGRTLPGAQQAVATAATGAQQWEHIPRQWPPSPLLV